MWIKNGDVVDICRGGHTDTVVITKIEVKVMEDESTWIRVSFKLARPGETTVTTVGLHLFNQWLQKAEVPA